MILKAQQDPASNDVEVLVRYAKMNQQVERLIALIRAVDTQVRCSGENSERLVDACDIFYIESVDKRTFVYLKHDVYSTNSRLYQLDNDLSHLGFVQISKSCILNIRALESIKPLKNSRMEATLKNGERLQITRKYLSGIKRALQGDMGL